MIILIINNWNIFWITIIALTPNKTKIVSSCSHPILKDNKHILIVHLITLMLQKGKEVATALPVFDATISNY